MIFFVYPCVFCQNFSLEISNVYEEYLTLTQLFILIHVANDDDYILNLKILIQALMLIFPSNIFCFFFFEMQC